ncbi:transcriptional regulator SinR [Fictibacillus macauensis ZFHKF-1]|uniref:Transcriptional regulator SinR n=1 Tax=Fictibacillus macauensis ZFHKF-1 TaxID=1196324 RepID=I8J1L1_9BACL|nr:helix-turn-helix domain-containing protein [Fictibacillus macauensis]EIT85621.1 transcriptional regulator SinR [Fictibacillus macauensis ZFHKF-1]
MIGEIVKKYRKEKNLSISALAERAGIAKSYLSSLERNIQTNPSVQLLEKLCAVLDLPVEQLLQENSGEEATELDHDWTKLVKEAMDSGISKEQFKEFLEYNKWKNDTYK